MFWFDSKIYDLDLFNFSFPTDPKFIKKRNSGIVLYQKPSIKVNDRSFNKPEIQLFLCNTPYR